MTEVLGRTVNGTITRDDEEKAEQRPGEEFLPLLDSVLEQSNVEAVRWTQYTPYFNDGDPCIFKIHGVCVKPVGGDSDAGDHEDEYIDAFEMLDWQDTHTPYTVLSGFESLHPVFKLLEDSMAHFEDFLRESFGDHAEITATRAGFDVEFYEHD